MRRNDRVPSDESAGTVGVRVKSEPAEADGDGSVQARQPPGGEATVSGDESPDEFDPFDDLDADGAGSHSEEPAEAVFADANVDTLDADHLWAELDDPLPPDAESTDHGDHSGEAVVPKERYCEACRYLSDPPAVSCTHEGTTIVEFVDRDHVRVRNCPVVARRRARGGRD